METIIDYDLFKLCALGAIIGCSAYCFFYTLYKVIKTIKKW